ncbi:MAG: class I SAM-dependent methyltransferase [Verrucomicrobia bacterium]|nr:class I SAM-dependent methyltransferase [Verrucomicrobiota bacterium]MBS0646918.1 class I SAM-dependent methyltransferase [Verrucomicrobiota bacterium]
MIKKILRSLYRRISRLLVSMLEKSRLGRLFLYRRKLKHAAFKPASIEAFRYLDRRGKKAVDTVYEQAFNQLFILLKSMHFKGDILEFGVFQGYSARLFAQYIQRFALRSTHLHLFDSFIGLPEEKEKDKNSYESSLGYWAAGSMAVMPGLDQYLHKKLAKILPSERLHMIKGFFEDTLQNYFAKKPNLKAMVVHVDCDLYSSSKYVLDFLFKNEIIQDGTLVIFDDWMTSLGNPNLGQRKATQEVLENYPMWSLEKYSNYGVGSHVFIAHDLRVTNANENRELACQSI